MRSSKAPSRADGSDARRCPLCEQPNQCALAMGETDPCWCVSVEISDALRQSVPAGGEARCICQRCASEENR